VPSEGERLKLSMYRQLVERYVNLAHWTTARKSALVLTLLVPSQLAAYSICVFIVTDQNTSDLNLALTNSMFVTWNTAIVMSCLIVWPVALRGKEGRWTAYLLVTVEIAGITWCEITDSAGHPVIVTTGDYPEDRNDRGSTRNQAKEESP